MEGGRGKINAARPELNPGLLSTPCLWPSLEASSHASFLDSSPCPSLVITGFNPLRLPRQKRNTHSSPPPHPDLRALTNTFWQLPKTDPEQVLEGACVFRHEVLASTRPAARVRTAWVSWRSQNTPSARRVSSQRQLSVCVAGGQRRLLGFEWPRPHPAAPGLQKPKARPGERAAQ